MEEKLSRFFFCYQIKLTKIPVMRTDVMINVEKSIIAIFGRICPLIRAISSGAPLLLPSSNSLSYNEVKPIVIYR